MQISRRRFFQTSAIAAAAVAAPRELFSEVFQEPSRASRPGGPILLNGNENPYGPWPSLMSSMQSGLALAHRYPDDQRDAFIAKIAELHRVKREQIVPGCGSGEILQLCAELFTSPAIPLVTASPTFEAIARHTQVRGREIKTVRLTADFAHDLDGMAAAVKGQRALFYICNPNNPTASLTPRKAIEAVLPKLHPKAMVLIDEAYHHFALSSPDYTSFLDQPIADDRIIVARTFSKIYGLAGLRMGYAVGAPTVIDRMRRYALPENINIVAATCGVAALNDVAGLAAAIQRNAVDRDEFLRQARQRNVNLIPSFGNFVMIDARRPIRQVIQHFRQNNVHIGRPFPPLDTHARISLGTSAEMKAFWTVWNQMKA